MQVQQNYQQYPQQNQNNQQEEVVQGKPIDFYQINQNLQTGEYQQQKVDVNLIAKQPQQGYQQYTDAQYQQLSKQQMQLQNQQNYQQQQQQQQTNKTQEELKKDIKPDDKNQIKYLVHVVTPADTLIGLSIRYNVSEYRIKQYNNLDSDEIWFKKEIKIPNPTTNIVNDQDDQNIDEIIRRQKIGQFKHHVLLAKDKSEKMAHYYLTEAEWDLNEAEKLYKEDLEWENQAAKQGKTSNIAYQNLLNKKRQ